MSDKIVNEVDVLGKDNIVTQIREAAKSEEKHAASGLSNTPEAGIAANAFDSPEAKKAEAAASKEMCVGFRKTFEEQQAKYSEAVFESLSRYFETPDTMEKLSIMLEKYFGMYLRSPKFGQRTGELIDKAFRDVIIRALRRNLKKGANLKGVYRELGIFMQKYAKSPSQTSTVGGTRSKRKPRRKTVKRRK